MNGRYEVYKDFNTKDWCVYDNVTHNNICRCDTEIEAQKFVAETEVADLLIAKRKENKL